MKVEIATRIIYFRETEGAGIMILKLVREMKGNEFVQQLKEKYGFLDNLKRLIKKDPENVLYPLDLEDWLYHLEHPQAKVTQSETIFLKDLKIDMSDLKLLDVIKKEHPTSIRNLSYTPRERFEISSAPGAQISQGRSIKVRTWTQEC